MIPASTMMVTPNLVQYCKGAKSKGISHQVVSAEQHNTLIAKSSPNRTELTKLLASMVRKAGRFLAITRYTPSKLANTGKQQYEYVIHDVYTLLITFLWVIDVFVEVCDRVGKGRSEA